VETIEVAMGQMLQGGETLMRILASQAVWAMVHMPERDLGRVRVGMPVTVTTVGYPDQPRGGTVSAISDLVDPNSRTAEVRVALNNPDGVLKPGMSGTATFQLSGGDNSLFLPIAAVQPLGGGPMAFVCKKDGSFAAVRVAVGEERDGLRPLLAGLKHTDAIVTEGAFNLRAQLMRQELEEP
jgi:cobalt-zinc-cadmium efflux system membrane fusion protein